MNEALNDFSFCNYTNASALGFETLGPQTNSCSNNFGRIVVGKNNECQNQVTENNIDDKVEEADDSAVMTVENRMHDLILTTMDNVVTPRVAIAVISITESSGRGPCSVVQNPDRSDFAGNNENDPLMSASSRIDFNVEQDGNDETRNVGNFEDGEFPILKSNYGRRAYTHHTSS